MFSEKFILRTSAIGFLLLFSGCGQPNKDLMKPGVQVYQCGVWTIAYRPDAKTLHGVKETGRRDEFGQLEFKGTKTRIRGYVTVDVWSARKETTTIDDRGCFKFQGSWHQLYSDTNGGVWHSASGCQDNTWSARVVDGVLGRCKRVY